MKEVTARPEMEEKRWSAPCGDWIKFNTDGAFSEESKQGGWGFVARDGKGTTRAAGAGHIIHSASAAQAEAVACVEALQSAADWGVAQVIIETDSSNLVRAIETTEFDRAPEGVIYRDIRAFVQLNFNSVKFVYCPRNCNKVAHALAAVGASRAESRRLWLDEVPDSVSMFVASDVAELLK